MSAEGSAPALRVSVVGGGLAGLSTAHALLRARPGLDVRVYEADNRPGGKVGSSRQEGFVLDWGPNGFVRNSAATVDLVEDLGLTGRCLPALPAARRRYVYLGGALRPLPSSPRDALGSRLLPPAAKLRALVGAARALPGPVREETVHGFLERRLGAAAGGLLAELMVSGLCAGDPRELSMDALFPRLRALEAQYGSLLRGMRAAGAEARERPEALDGRLTSFVGGMQTLVDALAERLGSRLRPGRKVVALQPPQAPGGVQRLRLDDGEVVESEVVVLATPAYAAAELLAPALPEAARTLAEVPYAAVQMVALGFAAAEVPTPMDGFGFLVPRGQQVRSLGVMWSSAVFPDQAPAGQVTLRAIAGGRLDPGFIDLDETAAVGAVLADLRLTMGITARPRSVLVKRWPRAIPQLTLGHRERIDALRGHLAEAWPGLALAGNYLSGVAVNNVIRDAATLAAGSTHEGWPGRHGPGVGGTASEP